jgi:pentose-5-phosphate-3-epimerase
MTLFKYFRLLLVTIIFGLSSYQFSWAAQANFSWLPNDPSDGTVGYILHYGKSSRNYTESVDVGSPAPVNGRVNASVATLEAEQTYYFTVTAYNAQGSESPYPNEVICITPSRVIPEFALRINAGGGEYTDGNGDVWSADSGFNTGNISSTTSAIGGTSNDVLFQTQRWDDKAGEELKYSFDVPDGDYVVNLYFAENYSGASYSGGRQFDILLEGSTVEYKLDIYDEVGKNTAHMKSYEVSVIDGQLNMELLHGIENPTIAAIEIVSFAVKDPAPAPSPDAGFALRVNAGGGAYTDKNGDVWSADSGYNTGNKSSTSVAISGTEDDVLFQTQRWDDASGEELKYSFDVPDGAYVVNLYFAENYTGALRQGARVFDVLFEGSNAERNFDIYSVAGANTALMRSYVVNVVDGQLNMEFLHGVENPTISAIEVLSSAVKDPDFVLLVNAGGGEYTDSNGDVWSADFGFNTGSKSSTSVAISGTEDDALFQTQRWDGKTGEELKYSFDVPNGNYVVNLYFAENYTGALRQGARVFDVLLEGSNVERNFDIYSVAGANTAHIRSYEVSVVDGQLNMEFLHGVENPTISAIEVFSH